MSKQRLLGVIVGLLPWLLFVGALFTKSGAFQTVSLISIFGSLFWAMVVFFDWNPEKKWRRPDFGGNSYEVIVSEGSSDFSKALAVTQVPLLVVGIIAFFYAVLHSAP
jgi:hypothetical protein